MAGIDDLALPLEIPWKLASTTQPLATGQPDQTAMSLFFFEPDEDDLTSTFPDDRLVFLKLTASVSPASFPASVSRLAAQFLGEGIPCFHLLLDLRVRKGGDTQGGSIRPYFHAAAPINRRMIQSGVIGFDSFEGESEGHLVGKSGSQMHESLRSHTNTLTMGGGASVSLGPVSVGGSVRNTKTDVSSDRSVAQVVDTTSREASEERRELVSHRTKVENILTLLNAKYVGTPHLTFSLSPQPLTTLSVDPADPNLWFQQLLARRSTGIEGIQEFTAVVVVPKGEDFCVNARLRRVCLLDNPPGPLTYEERFTGNLLQLARMVDYLNRTFPRGTPLDELDVDIIGSIVGTGSPTRFKRPVVELWGLRLAAELVEARVVSPSPDPGVEERGRANYKHFLEVWLDTLRDEYEREAARSPLERGILLGENRFLDTCFVASEDDAFAVGDTSATVGPLVRVNVRHGTFNVGGSTLGTAVADSSVRSRGVETVTRWNALEQQLANILANRGSLPETRLDLRDRRVLDVLVERWAKLVPDDEANLPFDEAATLLGLDDSQRKLLAGSGATDLRGIARAIKAALPVERHNDDVRRLRNVFKNRRLPGEPPDQLKFPMSGQNGSAVVDAIGAHLGQEPAQEPDEE